MNALTLEERIRMKRIVKYKHKVDFPMLLRNSNVTLGMIDYMLDADFHPIVTGETISCNPNLTMEYIKRKRPFIDWDWNMICFTLYIIAVEGGAPKITIEDVMRNKHLPWCWKWIWCWQRQVHQVTVQDIVHGRFSIDSPYDIFVLCSYENMSSSIDGIHDDIYLYLCDNPTVPLKLIVEQTLLLRYVEWDLILAKYPIPEIMKYELSIPNFSFGQISHNITATYDDVMNYSDVPWGSDVLCRTLIEFSDILKKPHLHWDYSLLSMNPHLTAAFFIDNIHMNWNHIYISRYLNGITFDTVESTSDKFAWEWVYISGNPSVLEVTQDELASEFRKINAINKIQSQFKQSYTSPEYTMCKNRLMREYECMETI